ncbi:DUF1444 family protein [Polaromonas sp. P5_D5]
MRWLLLVITLACQVSFAQGIPADEDSFTKVAAERVNKELPGYDVKPAGKLTLEGKRSDGESTGQLNLDRVYSFCARNLQDCSVALDQYAKGMAESVKERNRPIARSMVRLAVRPAAYVEQIRKQIAGSSGSVYSRPVAPGLVAIPVLDFTRSVRFVNDKDISKLSLTEDELFKLGEQNLRSNSKPFTEVTPMPTANSFGHIAGEDYASSRILFHDDWQDLSTKLNGKLVVMVPAPDILLYGDGSTSVGVEALRTFAADIARKSSRPLSPLMLQWTKIGWEVVK